MSPICSVNVSYIGLVRNVIGCGEEEIEVAPGTTVRELLGMLIKKHGDSFRMSVFRGSGELRSMALVCVNDCDISQLEGFETRVASGEKISVVVGVYPPEGG
jgi:molybdopterin converting factor small subunit